MRHQTTKIQGDSHMPTTMSYLTPSILQAL